jgi:BA14K-like protein
MWLFRLICLASLPLVGLAPLSATAAPALGPQAPSAANGVSQVQYLEVEPAPPPAVVEDDDGDDYDTGRVIGRFQDEGLSRCAAQFRSFEPDTGYYTTYDGDRVLCPYLQ